jgi:hypothetical protein
MADPEDPKAAQFSSDLVSNTIDTAGEILKNGADTVLEEADDMITLRSAPSPVNVSIGNYFYKEDMVITRASFNFSKECTKAGPLYVEISLDLTSRYILKDIKSVGFVSNKNPSRVSFAGLAKGI